MEIKVGKRYGLLQDSGRKDGEDNPIFESTGEIEILCIKPSKGKEGTLTYDGKELGVIPPKVLPSAD